MAKESTNALLFAIYIIGAVLIGGGIITFVAAHWEAIPAGIKVALIVAAMLAAHVGGYWLWKVSRKREKLGHALVALGTLIFGANIYLMAQVFHIKSNYDNGFGAWAIGAVVMAYALMSVPNIVIAGLASFVWFCGWMADHPHSFCWYPFAAAALFLPIAYIKRSVLSFLVAVLTIGTSVVVDATVDAEELRVFMASWIGVGALLFGWGMLSLKSANHKVFAVSALALGAIAICAITYIMSFRWIADEVMADAFEPESMMWIYPVAASFVAAGVMWVTAFGSMLRHRGVPLIALVVLPSIILLLATFFAPGPIVIVYAANILLFAQAASLVWCGVVLRDRRVFWPGILLAALVIISRFFEYETGLLTKSAVFVACGVGLIAGGVALENYLRKRKLVDE